MARIKNYIKDSNITNDDLLVGSSYEGQGQSGAVYRTRNYRLDDLAEYFSRNFNVDGVNYDLSQIAIDVGANTLAIATANQSLKTIADNELAQATFMTNLTATFGTFNDEGVLQSLSQSFADQVLQTTASDRYANAQFVTNLATSVGTFDENGNLLTIATSFADNIITTTSTDRFAESQFVNNLGASFGTVGPDGSITTFSSEYLNTITAYADDNSATASKVENLNAVLNVLDENGLPTTTSSDYLDSITTYVDNNSATAEALQQLTTQVSNIPATIRQDDEPAIYDAENNLIYPLGSIWVDTNDNNALYILAEDVNQTPSVFWQATTSEALGSLIESTAQLQEDVNLLSNDQSALATKTTTLTAQFGVYDPATNTFTIDADATYFNAVKNYADSESATAQKVESIGATFGEYDPETNSFSVSSASMTDIVDALTLPSYASTSRVNGIETSVGNIPLIFKQNDAPPVDSPLGSLWFDTDDNNKRYILTSGAPNTWDVLEDGEFQAFKSSATEDINTNASDVGAAANKITNLNAVLEILDENGDLAVATKADYFDEITTYVDSNSATASKVETLEATVGDGSSGLVASVATNQSAIADIDGNLDAQYGLQVTAGGAVAGMKLSASASDNGVASSAIAFNADVFKIFTGDEQNPNSQTPFLLNANGLFINVPLNGVSGSFSGDISAASGTFGNVTINSNGITSDQFSIDVDGNATFSGDISAATGTFTGGLNINNRFVVNSAGSTTIFAGDTSSRFEIQNDTGGSKFRLFGNKINFNSWIGGTNFNDAANSNGPGFLQFGGVAYMYSGNGTTTTANHHMTLDVYGGSKKLFLKADQITLRKSTTTGGSHTTIIEGDLEVQGNVSFTSSSSHPDTSSVSDSNNTGQTFIQNLVFDSYGHVTSFTSGTVSTDTPAIYADGSGNPQLTTGVTAAEVRALIGAGTSSFSGDYADLSNKPTLGTAAAANVGDFAAAGHNHTYNVNDAWLRDNGDNANVKLYGNSRQMVFRTDGTAEYASGVGGYPFVWMYGGDASSNRRMILNSDGNLWTSAYGWLHTAFASAGHLHDTRYLRKDTNSSSSGTITAQDFILSSDQRLKSDINTYTVKPINIKYRDYVINSNRDRRRVGVLAQELEESHPEFVTTNPDTGYKAVSYIDMLVAKVAELEERIKQLENGGA